jgi:cytochrome c oxidase subunit 4
VKAEEHILSYRKLLLVLVALLILTVLTIAVSLVNLGAANVWMALVIASTKATLVLLFFMHLKYETGWVIRASFVGAFCFLAILIGFIFWDISFR